MMMQGKPGVQQVHANSQRAAQRRKLKKHVLQAMLQASCM
jgi:hypothetical protein